MCSIFVRCMHYCLQYIRNARIFSNQKNINWNCLWGQCTEIRRLGTPMFYRRNDFLGSFLFSSIVSLRNRYYMCSKCVLTRTQKCTLSTPPFGPGKTLKIDAVLRKHYENWCSSRALLSSAPYTHWSWITYPRNKFLLAKIKKKMQFVRINCKFL